MQTCLAGQTLTICNIVAPRGVRWYKAVALQVKFVDQTIMSTCDRTALQCAKISMARYMNTLIGECEA